MLVFVDTEHASGYEKPWGERLLAARRRIKYRIEDITDRGFHGVAVVSDIWDGPDPIAALSMYLGVLAQTT